MEKSSLPLHSRISSPLCKDLPGSVEVREVLQALTLIVSRCPLPKLCSKQGHEMSNERGNSSALREGPGVAERVHPAIRGYRPPARPDKHGNGGPDRAMHLMPIGTWGMNPDQGSPGSADGSPEISPRGPEREES
eukprot:14385106-Alexandrium_andersonii.AAC.1